MPRIRISMIALFKACTVLAAISILLSAGHISGISYLQVSQDENLSFIDHKPLSNSTIPAHGGGGIVHQLPSPTPLPIQKGIPNGNATLLAAAPACIKAIMDPQDTSYPRLKCPAPTGTRYNYLKSTANTALTVRGASKPKYFFALDLREVASLLPRLIGSIVETMRFLGPQSCVLSIIEGRSDDGTFEVLQLLRPEIEGIGGTYYFNTSDLNPNQGARIEILAKLRNLALSPLTSRPENYAEDTTVLFLNDVAICMEDILELLHQKVAQNADMTCAMDWTYVGENPTFYDVWIGRDMLGETFFNIPADGNWNSAWNLFWANPATKQRFMEHKPFQVFSCWNGAVAFDAKAVWQPPLGEGIGFRGSKKKECFRGEPELFAKELWMKDRGKIAVVPSVNLEYSDTDGKRIKELKGYVSQWVEKDGGDAGIDDMKIDWQLEPPEKVKCVSNYEEQTWVPWNEGLESIDSTAR